VGWRDPLGYKGGRDAELETIKKWYTGSLYAGEFGEMSPNRWLRKAENIGVAIDTASRFLTGFRPFPEAEACGDYAQNVFEKLPRFWETEEIKCWCFEKRGAATKYAARKGDITQGCLEDYPTGHSWVEIYLCDDPKTRYSLDSWKHYDRIPRVPEKTIRRREASRIYPDQWILYPAGCP